MYLIPCDFDCVYQKEGYCLLKSPSVITNQTSNGCAHYIKKCPPKNEGISIKDPIEPSSSFQRLV